MLISTKKGDQGYTDIKGERVLKNDERIRVLGLIDETIAVILQADLKCNIPLCKEIVENLSAIAANTAGYQSDFDAQLTERIERIIVEKEGRFFFVYPYKDEQKILLNLCRVKVRTLEREFVSYENYSLEQLSFINRLSDYFFVQML